MLTPLILSGLTFCNFLLAIPFNTVLSDRSMRKTQSQENIVFSDNAVPSFSFHDSNDTPLNHKFSTGIFGGYGKSFLENIYLGSELSFKNNPLTSPFKQPMSSQRSSYHRKGNIFGLAPRIGYLFDQNLAYAKLDLESNQRKHKSKFIQADVLDYFENNKSTKTFFKPGFGWERNFGFFNARIEYSFAINSKATSLNNKNSKLNSLNQYTNHNFKLGFAYPF